MSRAADLLTHFTNRGVALWLDRGQIYYRAAHGLLASEDINALRELKTELLAELRDTREPSSMSEALDPQLPLKLVPLTIQQDWLWGLISRDDHLQPFAGCSYRIAGPLNVGTFGACLYELFNRHESLRTRIVVVGGVPHQRIDESLTTRFLDVNGRDGDGDIEVNIDEKIDDFFHARWSLTDGPLWKTLLVRIAAEEHVFAIAAHSIVSDAASLSMMLKELWAQYGDLAQNRASHRSLPIQYSSYAIWQRCTQNAWLVEHSNYWRTRLTAAVPIRIPQLPLKVAGDQNAAAPLNIRLDEALTSELYQLARREKVSLAVLFAALYAVLIARWCNQKDFVLPFNIAGRHRSVDINVLGYFAHILFLRVELTGDQTLVDVLRAISTEFQTSYEHSDFGRMAKERPDLLRGTFLQWLTENPLDSSAEIVGANPTLEVSPMTIKSKRPPVMGLDCDIVLQFYQTKGGIRGEGAFRAAKFSTENMERFCEEFKLIAGEIVRAPFNPIFLHAPIPI